MKKAEKLRQEASDDRLKAVGHFGDTYLSGLSGDHKETVQNVTEMTKSLSNAALKDLEAYKIKKAAEDDIDDFYERHPDKTREHESARAERSDSSDSDTSSSNEKADPAKSEGRAAPQK